LFLYVGFNCWTGGPTNIIGAAKQLMENFGGNVPDEKSDLLAFYGIGRKIMMLVLQDALFDKSEENWIDIGLVVDTHFQTSPNSFHSFESDLKGESR